MSEQRLPDMTDRDVRAMVLRDHEPQDHWMMSGQLIGVYCTRCGQRWPCPSIQAARAAERAAMPPPPDPEWTP
jgi:hypothetical protein